jgi:hypothetical protein
MKTQKCMTRQQRMGEQSRISAWPDGKVLMFTRAHSFTYCSLSGYLQKSHMSNAFFVSFFNHVLPDIQNQNQCHLTAESLVVGKNALCHYILAITVAKWKAKAGIAE